MSEKEELFEKTIAELASEFNWSTSLSRKMVIFANEGVRRAELDTLKAKTTLKDVVEKLEFNFYKTGRGGREAIYNALISLGLTRLDSVALPQKTVTVEMLKQLTKDKLLTMSACVLGTMSMVALWQCSEYYLEYIFKDYEKGERRSSLPTIAELLTNGHYWENKTMIYRTVILLRELGFTDDDGPFMQIADDTQKNIEKIMKKEAVDEKTAKLIVEMAQRRGWKI